MADATDETKLGKEKKEKIVKNTEFYSNIGGIGGRRTKEVQGAKFFSEIAKARHQRNREARAAILQPANNLPDGSGE